MLASVYVHRLILCPLRRSRPSQFYLVLDVCNLTAQEMTLNYTPTKSIIIEAKESCRVPVPVEKCPLERLLLAAEQQHEHEPHETNHSEFTMHPHSH